MILLIIYLGMLKIYWLLVYFIKPLRLAVEDEIKFWCLEIEKYMFEG